MTDESGLQPAETKVKTTMYRPAAGGGLEVADPERQDYREELRSRRWDAAPLENPEVEKTDPRIAMGALIMLAVVTFAIIAAGYVVGLWSLPA